MAQQSARRDRDNQAATPYFEYATLIWTRSANSHAGRRSMTAQEAGQMAASDLRVTAFLMFSLALRGASTDVARMGRLASGAGRRRTTAPFLMLRSLSCRSKPRQPVAATFPSSGTE